MTMKVVIIGESCTDRFHYGDVNRLNPEAPSPIFTPKYTVESYGMAGNLYKNLESLYNKINAHDQTEINYVCPIKTIIKERYVEELHNHILLRVDENDKVDEIVLTDSIMKLIKEADYVVVSDYDKGFLSTEDLRTIAKYAKISFLDTKKRISEWAWNFNWIKINEAEFKNCGMNETIKHLQKDDRLIITLGKRGARLNNKIFSLVTPVELMDVSGAGDVFLAAFAFAYMQSNDHELSIKFANHVSAKSVSFRGVVNNIGLRINDSEFKELITNLTK